jgi:hypothetical protein
LNESDCNRENIIRESLVLYQLKHPKGIDFAFEHYWLILREYHIGWTSGTIGKDIPISQKKVFRR